MLRKPVSKLILTGTTLGWLLCLVGFGFLAFASASDDRACVTEDRRFADTATVAELFAAPPLTKGEEEWSWLPPGKTCRYTVADNGFDDETGPGPWFSVGVVGMVASLGGLVYTRWRARVRPRVEADVPI